MTGAQQAAWNDILHWQVGLAALLILIVAVGLTECRYALRRRPRLGALIGYGLLMLAFATYKASAFNEDAKLLFSSGLLGLAVSLIASVILSDPPKANPSPTDPIDKAIAAGLATFKERVAAIKAARLAPLHKELKLQNISQEFALFLEQIERIESREEQEPAA